MRAANHGSLRLLWTAFVHIFATRWIELNTWIEALQLRYRTGQEPLRRSSTQRSPLMLNESLLKESFWNRWTPEKGMYQLASNHMAVRTNWIHEWLGFVPLRLRPRGASDGRYWHHARRRCLDCRDARLAIKRFWEYADQPMWWRWREAAFRNNLS